MPAKTTGWTAADVTDPTHWDVAANWSNGVPVTTDTVQFLDGSKSLPDTNLPNAGEVFVLVIDGASEGSAWSGYDITAFCGDNAYVPATSGWTYSGLTIGASGRNYDNILLDRDSAAGGTITTWGEAEDSDSDAPVAIANATITVKSGGGIYEFGTDWTITRPITVETGGLLYIGYKTLFANGGVNLAGTLDISEGPGAVLDVASPINCTGDCVINWGSGTGVILGGLNAYGHTITHTGTAAGNSITCDVTGTLDLGTTTANSIAVDIQGNIAVTLGASFACYSFKSTSGTPALTGAAKTVTVGAGGLSQGGMTLAVAAGLSVTVAESCNVSWPTAASLLQTLNVATDKIATQTGSMAFRSKNGAGTLAGVAQSTYWQPGANTDVCDGPVTGTSGVFYIQPATNGLVIPSSLNLSTRVVTYNKYATANLTLSGLASGALTVAPGTPNTLTLTINGAFSGTSITLGAGAAQYGILVLASGYAHEWTTLAKGSTGTANGMTYAGQCNVGGNQTWTGIAVTLAAGTVIRPTAAAVKIDCTATGATSVTDNGADLFTDGAKVLTVDYLPAMTVPIRTWCGVVDGGHNHATAVVFHPGPPDEY